MTTDTQADTSRSLVPVTRLEVNPQRQRGATQRKKAATDLLREQGWRSTHTRYKLKEQYQYLDWLWMNKEGV